MSYRLTFIIFNVSSFNRVPKPRPNSRYWKPEIVKISPLLFGRIKFKPEGPLQCLLEKTYWLYVILSWLIFKSDRTPSGIPTLNYTSIKRWMYIDMILTVFNTIFQEVVTIITCKILHLSSICLAAVASSCIHLKTLFTSLKYSIKTYCCNRQQHQLSHGHPCNNF